MNDISQNDLNSLINFYHYLIENYEIYSSFGSNKIERSILTTNLNNLIEFRKFIINKNFEEARLLYSNITLLNNQKNVLKSCLDHFMLNKEIDYKINEEKNYQKEMTVQVDNIHKTHEAINYKLDALDEKFKILTNQIENSNIQNHKSPSFNLNEAFSQIKTIIDDSVNSQMHANSQTTLKEIENLNIKFDNTLASIGNLMPNNNIVPELKQTVSELYNTQALEFKKDINSYIPKIDASYKETFKDIVIKNMFIGIICATLVSGAFCYFTGYFQSNRTVNLLLQFSKSHKNK